MEKRIECSVCGKEFDLKKDERYTGFEKGLLGETYYDCYDCPNCGVQYAAQIRFHGAGRNRYPGGDMQSARQGNDRISV